MCVSREEALAYPAGILSEIAQRAQRRAIREVEGTVKNLGRYVDSIYTTRILTRECRFEELE